MKSYLVGTALLGWLAAGGCYDPDIPNRAFTCAANDSPACPDGMSCVAGYCMSGSALTTQAFSIPKVLHYNGERMNPLLDTEASCPDYSATTSESLEPNNTLPLATSLSSMFTTPDRKNPAKLNKLAICPTGSKDVDFYQADLSSYGNVQSLVASIDYQVAYGDLDIAIVGADGVILSYDGTAVDNGCTSSAVSAGVYFVAVVGADNVDVNNYTLHVITSTSAKGCSGQTPDGGTDGGHADGGVDGSTCQPTYGPCQSNDDCCLDSCTLGSCN